MPSSTRRVALITGAGRRVGSVIARELATAGYATALHANHSLAGAQALADELIDGGRESIALAADLHSEEAIRRLVDDTVAHFGRIDALVNSAAIWQPKPLESVTAADVREHFDVNTLAMFLACQHAGLRMCAQPSGGAIVNIGDWAVVRPYANYSAYFTAKGSVPTLTRTMAVELSRRNPSVRVNAILPGPVLLPPDLSAAERAAVIDSTLVRRAGQPEHIAHGVKFLFENEFVTGICLPIDGGRSIFSSPTEEWGGG